MNASIAALRNAAATTSLDSPVAPVPPPATSNSSGTFSANGSGKFSDPAFGGSGGIAGGGISSSNGSGRTYTSTGPQMVDASSYGSGFNRVPIATPGYRGPMTGLNTAPVVGGNNNVVNASSAIGGYLSNSGRYS